MSCELPNDLGRFLISTQVATDGGFSEHVAIPAWQAAVLQRHYLRDALVRRAVAITIARRGIAVTVVCGRRVTLTIADRLAASLVAPGLLRAVVAAAEPRDATREATTTRSIEGTPGT